MPQIKRQFLASPLAIAVALLLPAIADAFPGGR
jgi:hypothetical protein